MAIFWGVPSTIHFGCGSLNDLPDIVKMHAGKHVLLITDPGIMKIGLGERVMDLLKNAGITYFAVTNVEPNPTDIAVDKIIEDVKGEKFDVILALGGGSPIDMAKGVNIMLHNEGPITKYDGLNLVPHRGMPLIAVPTTAGTGSEASAVCVVTDTKKVKKMVMAGINVGPSFAVCDPELTVGLPPKLTAAIGMDALAHAMESYISRFANPMCQVHSLRAANLIYNNLVECYKNPANIEARSNQMMGATTAAFAFSSANLGLCHAVAMPLGAHFGISHGDGNAVCLAQAMDYNSHVVPEMMTEMGEAMGMGSGVAPAKVVENLRIMGKEMDLPKLKDLGIGEDKFTEEIIDAVEAEIAMEANPKRLSRAEILDFLKAI